VSFNTASFEAQYIFSTVRNQEVTAAGSSDWSQTVANEFLLRGEMASVSEASSD
jgi:hypothetical protein